MTCKDAIRLMCAYLEGRLSPPVAKSIRRHVAQCNDCQLVMNAAQKTLEAYFDGTVELPANRDARVA